MRQILGLAVIGLLLAAGLCLLDAAGHHSASAGLCGLMLALAVTFAVVPTLPTLERLAPGRARAVYWTAIDPTTPPPRR